jgi:hypothetical protein
VREYSTNYNAYKTKVITTKIKFSNAMSLICFGLVILCGIVIIPLFSRVQARIWQLMYLFFMLDKDQLKEALKNAIEYRSSITEGLDPDAVIID